jgi:hypothetical protein
MTPKTMNFSHNAIDPGKKKNSFVHEIDPPIQPNLVFLVNICLSIFAHVGNYRSRHGGYEATI